MVNAIEFIPSTKQAERFLRASLGTREVWVEDPRDPEDGQLYAVFLSEDSREEFQRGLESEDIIIWESDSGKSYGFSRLVITLGVRMRRDGTGEPDFADMVDCAGYKSVKETLLAVTNHVHSQRVKDALEYYEEAFVDSLKD